MPALLVLALAVLLSVVLPSINGEAAYRNELHKGDIVELADGITLVPSAGWNLAAGSLFGHTRSPVGSTADTDLVNGAVDFNVQAAPFDGTPSALLTRVNQINRDLHRAKGRAAASTGRYPVTTRQGVVGVAEDFVGVARQGSIIAFVFRPRGASTGSTRQGVEIVVSGPKDEMSRLRDDIVGMIHSIRAAS